MINVQGLFSHGVKRKFGCILSKQSHINASRGKSNIKIPNKKTWSDTAVLQALSDSIRPNTLKNAFYPMYAADLQPSSRYEGNGMVIYNKKGQDTAEYVLNNNPLLKNIEWNTDQQHEFDLPDSIPTKDKTTADVIDDLIDQKNFTELMETYVSLVNDGSEVSEELTDKVIGFLTFILRTYKKSDEFSNMIDVVKRFTKSSYCSLVRLYSLQHSFLMAISTYEKMVDKGYVPDSKTTDMLISCLTLPQQNSGLLDKFMAVWQRHRAKPTPQTICTLGSGYHKIAKKRESDMAVLWGKCISEMKYCDVTPNIDVYAAMMSFSVSLLKSEPLIWAILDIIEQRVFLSTDNHHTTIGFIDVMVWASVSNNLPLGKRVYEVAQKLDMSGILSVNDQRNVFYTRYLILLSALDTLENFISATLELIPSKQFYATPLHEGLLENCVKRGWPQVLPVLFYNLKEFGQIDRYFSWLAAALTLVDKADAETLIQFKHIAQILYSFMRYNSRNPDVDFFFSVICILIAKSGDKDVLVTTLTNATKYHRHLRLEQNAVEICKKLLGSDLHPLKPYM